MEIRKLRSKATGKSIYAATIDYKGKKIDIDLNKAATKTFSTTATLVIVSMILVNAPELTQKVGEGMVKTGTKLESYGEQVISVGEELQEDKDYNTIEKINYLNAIYENWCTTGCIKFDDGDTFINFETLAKDILSNEEMESIKVYAYCNNIETNPFTKKDLFEKMAQLEGKNYSDLEEYVQANGYESVEEWKKHCDDLVIEQLKKQELSQSLEEHGIDNSHLSIEQKEEMQSNYEVSSEYWVDRICSSEDPHLAFYKYYKASTKDEIYLDMVVSQFTFHLANSELNEFNIEYCESFSQYLMKMGFTNVDEWIDFNQEKLSQINGRSM